MEERLYCPDFSAIFDGRFANPFTYPTVDTLQWPLFTDVGLGEKETNLLSLIDEAGHPVFYRRKISTSQWHLERECAGIGHVLFQAFYLDGSRQITSRLAVDVARRVGNASAVACPLMPGDVNGSQDSKDSQGSQGAGHPGGDFGVDFLEAEKDMIAGVVFYPLFQDVDPDSPFLGKVLSWCDGNGVPVKWDFHRLPAPGRGSGAALATRLPDILELMDVHVNTRFILAGLDTSGLDVAIELMKARPRLWLELDPRIIGGTSPAGFFSSLFSRPGFVQNCWDRVVVGSATPTLEASQVTRGILEATASLPFHQRALLRTWLQRNALRVFKLPLDDICIDKKFQSINRSSWKRGKAILDRCHDGAPGAGMPAGGTPVAGAPKDDDGITRVANHAIVDYECSLDSFAITQLLWIQPLLLETWKDLKQRFSRIELGSALVRTYHTTTSIVMNEHERGNFLQLHYDLAERTREDPSGKLHTVAAEENRADFNYPDHRLASSVGSRSVVIPIVDGKLQMGGRENYYVLVTFGPRGVKLKVRYDIYF